MANKVQTFVKPSSPCTCQNLRRASLAITKLYDQKLAQSGLTVSQFSLLKTIKRLGPVSVSELAAEVRLDRTTLVRNLKPLEGEGLIVDTSPRGSRNRQLQLTAEGLKRYESAELLWQEAQGYIKEQLGPEQLNTLVSLLSEIEKLG